MIFLIKYVFWNAKIIHLCCNEFVKKTDEVNFVNMANLQFTHFLIKISKIKKNKRIARLLFISIFSLLMREISLYLIN